MALLAWCGTAGRVYLGLSSDPTCLDIDPSPTTQGLPAGCRERSVSTSLSQTVRCPQCSAQVRTGTDWCTLCFADLRPPLAVLEPAFGELAAAPLRRGKHSRSQTSDTAAIAVNVDALAEQMLAELKNRCAACLFVFTLGESEH